MQSEYPFRDWNSLQSGGRLQNISKLKNEIKTVINQSLKKEINLKLREKVMSAPLFTWVRRNYSKFKSTFYQNDFWIVGAIERESKWNTSSLETADQEKNLTSIAGSRAEWIRTERWALHFSMAEMQHDRAFPIGRELSSGHQQPA